MDILGLIISVLFIFALIIISAKLFQDNDEFSRKFVHIGVCNWWIIASLFFTNVYWASIVPFLFVILNYISYKKNIFASIERKEKNSLGTIYYAVSCLLLTLVSFIYFNNMLYGGIGLLVMGYGDGFAAIFGMKFKSYEYQVWKQKRTVIGSITMFVCSFIVIGILTLVFGQFSLLNILLISCIATIIEAVSPHGLDNLTVPLLTTFVAYLII